MSSLLLRGLEHVHGHLGWLSALALCHPAMLLRRPRRRAIGVALAATALVTVTAALGAVLYPAYRTAVKPLIFAAAPAVGEAFERKEHLGVAAVALAWLGLALHWLHTRNRSLEPDLARLAFVAYLSAAAFSLLTASLGLVVAVHRTF
jgi:hypothetical protein